MAENTPQAENKDREQLSDVASPATEQQALTPQAEAPRKVVAPITPKPKKDKPRDRDTETPMKYQNMGPIGQFLVSMLLFLTQIVDPNNKSNDGLLGMISKAFGFEDDANHTQFRNLQNDIKTKGRNYVRDTKEYALNPSAAREALAAGSSIISRNAPVNPTERQSRVMAVLGDASKSAGVSSDLAVGMWGYESSFGRNLKSHTGCQGDFQFTRTTMTEVISKKGTVIAADLNEKAKEFAASSNPAQRTLAPDLQKQAELVLNIEAQTKGMNGDQLKSFANRNRSVIDSLSNTPEASTYAATHYMKMVSDQMKLNPHSQRDFGLIYAGYNIGVGNALDIKNGRTAQGWEVNANAGVAGKGSASAQRASYDRAIVSRLSSAEGQMFSQLAREDTRSGEMSREPSATDTIRVAKVEVKERKGLDGTENISGKQKSAAVAETPAPQAQTVAAATPAERPRRPALEVAMGSMAPSFF